MNPVAVSAAIFLGGLWAMRRDPLAWSLLVICIWFGVVRWRSYAPIVAAAIITGVAVLSLLPWWGKLGIAPSPDRIVMMFLREMAVAYAGFGIGRLLAWAARL